MTKKTKMTKDNDGNMDCKGCEDCKNCVECDNSTWCYNSMGCYNSARCNNSTGCDNSTWCDNSMGCDNCAYCFYCADLVLEKFMVFNKCVGDRESFLEIFNKIYDGLGFKHPKRLTKSDIAWLKKNIEQFDQKVLDRIIEESMLPDKPRE